MTEIRWSAQSMQDLTGIHAWIAQESPNYADLAVQRIIAAVERLRDYPELGRVVPERQDAHLPEVIVGPFRTSIGTAMA